MFSSQVQCAKSSRPRVFTGVKPTGRAHVGNFLGAILPLLALARNPDHDLLVCVADLHALTVPQDPTMLREGTLRLAAMLLACGVDPATLFVQSMVPYHTELSYLLECVATYGEMARMVQFKQAAASGSTKLSLLTYPALMAADILAYQTDLVPVGDDQIQHLELTAVLARRFNNTYSPSHPVLVIPEGLRAETATRVKDLRHPEQKMGKSNADPAGTVFLDDAAATIVAKVRVAVTDPDPVLYYDPVTRPGVSNLAEILAALLGTDPDRALSGLRGGAALKAAVAEALVEVLVPIQTTYDILVADQATLLAGLSATAARVAPIAGVTTAAAKEALGLLSAGV